MTRPEKTGHCVRTALLTKSGRPDEDARLCSSRGPACTAEVDRIDASAWADLVQNFGDLTIYQTWPYETARWGEHRVSRLVLRRGTDVIAAAQVRLIRLPVLNAGIAYVFRGPLWRLRGAETAPEVFREMLRALRTEYATRRGLLLRLLPNEVDEETNPCRAILEAEGFHRSETARPHRTFLLDLSPSMEDLRKALRHAWRTNLNKADKRAFQIEMGADDTLYGRFLDLYRQMHDRKQFVQLVDVNHFREVQRRLPDPLKMQVMICSLEGAPVAAGVCSALGQAGIQLFLATSARALEIQGAFRVFWTQIQWLKDHGFRFFDLGGIDPESNPGGYRFKAGLSGREVNHIGEFQVCESPVSAIAVKTMETGRAGYLRSRTWLNQVARSWLQRKPRKQETTGGATVETRSKEEKGNRSAPSSEGNP
jgi:lipid II:glycine glycyltransferase (peptidoglycan interpeptide bridge formation enzyme)